MGPNNARWRCLGPSRWFFFLSSYFLVLTNFLLHILLVNTTGKGWKLKTLETQHVSSFWPTTTIHHQHQHHQRQCWGKRGQGMETAREGNRGSRRFVSWASGVFFFLSFFFFFFLFSTHLMFIYIEMDCCSAQLPWWQWPPLPAQPHPSHMATWWMAGAWDTMHLKPLVCFL